MKRSNIFSPDERRINPKTLKLQAGAVFGLSVFIFILFLVNAVSDFVSDNKVVLLEAYNNSDIRTYKHFETNGHSFVTGTKGMLHFKAQNFFDYLILQRVAGKSIIDCLFYLLIGYLIFRSVQKITDERSFSDKLLRTFGTIGLLLFVFPVLRGWLDIIIAEPLLKTRTNNMFELVSNSPFETDYIIAVSIILMLLYFLKKGKQLQEEQELTI
jgi:hypothetical protein